MRYKLIICLTALFLFSCSQNIENSKLPKKSKKTDDTLKVSLIKENDTIINNKHKGLDLFIDSMISVNYLIDTIRLKKISLWKDIAKYPKEKINNNIIILYPFPLHSNDLFERREDMAKELETISFSNPRTYFFAYWNEKEQSFLNGNDYILMTWTIDEMGIKMEKKIFDVLINYRINCPIFCFRNKNEIYALMNRMSVNYNQTKKVAETLRNYVNKESKLYDYTISNNN